VSAIGRALVVSGWFGAMTGNETELVIYPGGARGFMQFPNDLSKSATAKMDAFLNRVLG
jgi:hypothetical protein